MLIAHSVALLLPLLIALSVALPCALWFFGISCTIDLTGTDGPGVLWFALPGTDGPGALPLADDATIRC